MKYPVLALLIFLAPAVLAAQAGKEDFDAGCKFYKSGEYDMALGKFKAAENIAPSAGLFYDIGNTYFRLGKTGQALVYYERSRKISPSDDCAYNIKFLSGLINDPDYSRNFFDSLGAPSLKLFFAFSLLFFSISASVKLVSPGKKIFWPLVISCLLLAVSASAYYLKYSDGKRLYAVAIDNGAAVRSGPDYSFKVNFTLPEGKKVLVLGRSDKWIEVGVRSLGIRGWVEINRFEFI